jgi:hypothetical protein
VEEINRDFPQNVVEDGFEDCLAIGEGEVPHNSDNTARYSVTSCEIRVNRSVPATAVIDTGATKSLVNSDFAEKLLEQRLALPRNS